MAGILTGTLTADDRRVGADLSASSALLTLGLVNMSYVVKIKGDGTEFTNILTAMCKTATAGVSNPVTADRALIAGNINNLNDVGIFLITAQSKELA